MLQLRNTTPFSARLAAMPDEQGVESLYIIVKGSFRIGSKWTLLEEQSPPLEGDLHWGEPSGSSLKYASDFLPDKVATDFAVIGFACAPDMKPVTKLDVGVAVADKRKQIRVYGDRVWDRGQISSPMEFERMPLVYERAYGGSIYDGETLVDSDVRNPVGRGFSGGRSYQEMNGERLPNLENPRQPIRGVDDRPEPACFGFCAPHWYPRAGFAGTFDQAWQTERAPYLPLDFDKKFLNAAHPDLICDGFLLGGERVTITHMHPGGVLDFELPSVRMIARITASSEDSVGFNLETVVVEPEQLCLSMVWKSKVVCTQGVLKVKQVAIHLQRQDRI